MRANLRLASSFFVACLCVIGFASASHAAWPSDPTVNLPVCTAPDDQNFASVISDGAGGAIIAWQDRRNSATTWYDIYAQRVDANGTPLWTANGVLLCNAPNAQWQPVLVPDGVGGAIVAWEDFRAGNFDIYAQRVSAAGVPQWAANGVALCTALHEQQNATIVSDGAGGAIVAWSDARNDSNDVQTDIYAQRVDASGTPQWTANGVALYTAANEQNPYGMGIVSDGAAGAIVTWGDDRKGIVSGINDYDIYAQRVDATGTPLWTANGVALCTAANSQDSPTIVSDGAGGAIVSWEDDRNDPDPTNLTNYDIYAQRVDGTGAPQWTANGVALCTAANGQGPPTIASDGAGGAIVTWGDFRGGVHYDVYAQRVNVAGAPQWAADGVALSTGVTTDGDPLVVSDGAGGAIATWTKSTFPKVEIDAQRVNAPGVPQWTANGVALSTAATTGPGYLKNFLSAAAAPDGAGGAIVTWDDHRSGTVKGDWDIYAQNVNADGTLGGTVVAAVAPSHVAAGFALSRVEPNPSAGDLRVSFSLPDDAPARLEIYDLMGRRIESMQLGSLGVGAHVVSMGARSAWRPGIYGVSLTQGSRSAFREVAIVR